MTLDSEEAPEAPKPPAIRTVESTAWSENERYPRFILETYRGGVRPNSQSAYRTQLNRPPAR